MGTGSRLPRRGREASTDSSLSLRSSSRARPVKKMRLEEGARNGSVARSQSGLRDASQGAKLDKQQRKRDKKGFARMGKAGESDRRIQEKKPKHLFCGKRGIGKNDRR